MNMKDFTKVSAIGHSKETGTTWVKVKYEGGRLSITGVEGPLRNGDARGGCGQIVMDEWCFDSYREGWNADMVRHLRDVWNDWHLNDLSPCSPEMRALGWCELAKEGRLGYSFTLATPEATKSRKARELLESAKFFNMDIDTILLQSIQELAARPYTLVIWLPENTVTPGAPGGYEPARDIIHGCLKRPEHKTLGWLRPSECPEGLLGRKVFPTDEYGYGGKWWHKEVPEAVLEFLRGLPEPQDKPAWV
jgi:hypothetical protein